MQNNEVKKCLIDKGMTLTDLAKKIGYSRVHVSNVIHGHWQSQNVRTAIARALGKSFHDLWGNQDHVIKICMAEDWLEGND
jgi:lambda repressor-like predicted transcriptional regulator